MTYKSMGPRRMDTNVPSMDPPSLVLNVKSHESPLRVFPELPQSTLYYPLEYAFFSENVVK